MRVHSISCRFIWQECRIYLSIRWIMIALLPIYSQQSKTRSCWNGITKKGKKEECWTKKKKNMNKTRKFKKKKEKKIWLSSQKIKKPAVKSCFQPSSNQNKTKQKTPPCKPLKRSFFLLERFLVLHLPPRSRKCQTCCGKKKKKIRVDESNNFVIRNKRIGLIFWF